MSKNKITVEGIDWDSLPEKYKHVIVVSQKVFAATDTVYIPNETELLYIGDHETRRPVPKHKPVNVESINDIADEEQRKSIIADVKRYAARHLSIEGGLKYKKQRTLTLHRCSKWGNVSARSLMNEIVIPFFAYSNSKWSYEPIYTNEQSFSFSFTLKPEIKKLEYTREYESWVYMGRRNLPIAYMYSAGMEVSKRKFHEYDAMIHECYNTPFTMCIGSELIGDREVPVDVIAVYCIEMMLRDQGLPYKVLEYGAETTKLEVHPELANAASILKTLRY